MEYYTLETGRLRVKSAMDKALKQIKEHYYDKCFLTGLTEHEKELQKPKKILYFSQPSPFIQGEWKEIIVSRKEYDRLMSLGN
jgi:hypothetical protein